MALTRDRVFRFQTRVSDARAVYLVTEAVDGTSDTSVMTESKPGVWELSRRLPPGEYDFHYFSSDGASLRPHGAAGLKVVRSRSRSSAAARPPVYT